MESPVPLQDIYYPAHVSTSVSRRLYEQEWLSEKTQNGPKRAVPKKPSRRQGDSIRGDAFVEKTRKVVILGGPGAGKTTFLKFLALAHSDETLFKNSDLKTKLVPFFIHLPKLSKTGLGILEFLAAPLCDKTTEYGLDFVKREMNKGGVLLLLDSLDEVPVAQRQELISKIRYFESIYPKVRILVSCRTADYEEVLENFTEVELARLSDDAIKKIVSAWFIADPEKANRLLSLIASDEGVASLTETPLLLSLLCIQFRHDLQLPKRKVELYRRCIDALLRDWDSSRGFRRESEYENLSDDRKERLFEHIAGNFFIDHEAYEFKIGDTINVVAGFIDKLGIASDKAKGILDEIERHHGIIEQLSKDLYCFSHSSLQEYFVARHLLAKRVELDFTSKHIENENWLPIIEFIVALAEDPSEVLELLIKKSTIAGLSNFPPMGRRTKLLWLLYRCLIAAPFVDKNLISRCYQHLIESQVNMSIAYSNAKVYPLALLDSAGIRHVMISGNRPRPTLATALQPYRKFTNQIYSTPLDGYCDAVISHVDKLLASNNTPIKWSEDALIVGLLLPIASSRPNDVRSRLSSIQLRRENDFMHRIIQTSINLMDKSGSK